MNTDLQMLIDNASKFICNYMKLNSDSADEFERVFKNNLNDIGFLNIETEAQTARSSVDLYDQVNLKKKKTLKVFNYLKS